MENETPGAYDDELERKFKDWNKALDSHYGPWLAEAKDCFDLTAGEQWTQEERSQMQEIEKIPVTFDRIGVMVDAVSGYEIQTRQEVAYLPRTVEDTAVDDILTNAAKWVMDGCDGESEESDAFRDMIICGVGVTQTIVDVDEDSRIMVERRNPLAVLADPSSRKGNYADRRYQRYRMVMSKDAAEDFLAQLEINDADVDELADDGNNFKRATIVDPRVRYTHGMLGENDEGEVVLDEWEWFEREKTYMVSHEGQAKLVDADEFGELFAANPSLDHVSTHTKKFYRAICNQDNILKVMPLKTDCFTYRFMTGKRDHNKRTYYGIVRAMKDPQRWANKLYSQILDVMRKSAQGGLLMEKSAVDDIQEFESSYTGNGTTWVNDGALANKRVEEKTPPQYPQGMDRLMEVAVTSIRDTTGINQEMLGLAGREQAGVLEHQRKQAAMGILAPFFDSRTRYHHEQGKLLLQMMKLYISEGQLIRIVGKDGSPEYVPLVFKDDTIDYDVIVDEAPTSPNQKTAVFQIMMQLLPVLSQADLPASFWSEFAIYSPLPASMAQKLAAALTEADKGQQEAEAQQAQMQQQMGQMQFQLEALKTQSEANRNNAAADHAKAQAGNLMADAQRTQIDTQIGASQHQVDAEETASKVRLNNAKAGESLAKTLEMITGSGDE
jgi:hypothetical protein